MSVYPSIHVVSIRLISIYHFFIHWLIDNWSLTFLSIFVHPSTPPPVYLSDVFIHPGLFHQSIPLFISSSSLFSSIPCFIHTSIPLLSICSYLYPSSLCIHPFLYFCPYIHPFFTHLSIIPLFYPSVHSSIHHSFFFFIHPPLNRSVSICWSFFLSINHLSFHLLSVHSSLLPSLPLHTGLQFLRVPCLKLVCCTNAFKNQTEDWKHVRISM